ncbi:phage portal protein [Corynebacterium variabile]|uniref:phage portal protein n=1 Tax=Corynebacterium variabile TaxID=1727 RepID=UPI003C9444EE
MGILTTIRDALALPALAARASHDGVPFESPFASPNHLVTVTPPVTPARITRAYAMAVPPVARARRLIVGAIARCPLEARTAGARAETQPLWLTRTDGVQSPWHRMTWTVDDLLFHGWSLWGLERDTTGKVIRADRVPYHLWDTTDDGVMVGGKIVDAAEVCLIPGPDEGLLSTAAAAIRHAAELNRLAQRAADTPAAQVLLRDTSNQPSSDAEIKALIQSWVDARRGVNGGVAYTNQSVEVVELGKADPGLLVEGRNAAALDIARACGIPASMIDAAPAGATGTLTYQNGDARNQELVDYALAPFMAAIAARLGLDDIVPRGWAVSFDLTDLTAAKIGDVDVPDDDRQNYDPAADYAGTPDVRKGIDQ